MNKEESIKRRSLVAKLKSQRFNFTEIGEMLGVSRARAHQIYSGYKPMDMRYREIRSEVLKRDNNECQWKIVCKRSKKNLIIHHIDFNDRNNTLKNLITLCKKCHSSFHSSIRSPFINNQSYKLKNKLEAVDLVKYRLWTYKYRTKDMTKFNVGYDLFIENKKANTHYRAQVIFGKYDYQKSFSEIGQKIDTIILVSKSGKIKYLLANAKNISEARNNPMDIY